jgi:FKBP-type peptidyl-prolyl cis-trans isomerase
MKKLLRMLTCSFCAVLIAGMACAAPQSTTTKSDTEKTSYAIGVNMIKQLKERGAPFDAESIVRGLEDRENGKSKLSDAEVSAAIQKMRDDAQKRVREEREKKAAEKKKRDASFLSDYVKKEGVKTLPGGVMYRVLKAGEGKKPTDSDTVVCHYRGTLVDGTQFDASKPDSPAIFAVSDVIPGWSEALMEMPVGSKWEVVIPADKGYGEAGSGKKIGPNEILVFEIELLSIK